MLTATITANGRGTIDPFDRTRTWEHTAWKVTLRYEGRIMSTPFYSGIGNTDAPTAADVLECLLSDASSADMDYDDWRGEFGYEDEQTARRTYNAVVRQTAKLRSLLGDHFDEYVWPEDIDQEESARRLVSA